MYVCVCGYVYIYIYIYIYMCVCVYVCMYVFMYVCVCVCMYVCVYVCTCAKMARTEHKRKPEVHVVARNKSRLGLRNPTNMYMYIAGKISFMVEMLNSDDNQTRFIVRQSLH